MDSTHVFDCQLSDWTDLSSYDSVAFDEGQFYPNLPEVAERLADEGKYVAIAALNSAFYRSGFQPIMELVSKVESIVLLSSSCAFCPNNGYFTMRRDNTPFVNQKTGIFRADLIGGPEAYVVLCRGCYLERLKENF